jgi:hypothetical protein
MADSELAERKIGILEHSDHNEMGQENISGIQDERSIFPPAADQ